MATIIVTVLFLVLVYRTFCNTVCIYGHANKASRCLLLERQALLTIWAKLKLAVLFYFSVTIDSGEILASVWQEE